MRIKKIVAALIALLILILGGVQWWSVNRQPVAKAGNDQTVLVTDTVQLDGSGSSDPNSDQLTFAWSLIGKPSDSNALLSDPSVVNPTFKADTGLQSGQLRSPAHCQRWQARQCA